MLDATRSDDESPGSPAALDTSDADDTAAEHLTTEHDRSDAVLEFAAEPRTRAKMTRPLRIAIEVFRFVLPFAIIGVGYLGFKWLGAREPIPKKTADVDQRVLVRTEPVTRYAGGFHFDVDGMVVPYREVRLATEVPGRIIEKSANCRPGRFVTTGDILFRIDPRDFELEVRRLGHELEQSTQRLNELDVGLKNEAELLTLADEEVELRERELERFKTLGRRNVLADAEIDRGLKELITAKNNRLGVNNRLRISEASRRRLEAARELIRSQQAQAELNLARCTIVAPLSGVIVQELVEADSFVQKGAELVTIEDTSAVEVKCSLRMDQLRWLWAGREPESMTSATDDPAQSPAAGNVDQTTSGYDLPQFPVTVGWELDGQSWTWSGHVGRYDGIGLDEKTRTVPVRIVVPDPRQVRFEGSAGPIPATDGPPALMRGMYVTVRVDVDPEMSLLRVPATAVQPGNRVWLVRNGQLEQEVLAVAREQHGMVLTIAATAPVRDGDRVVVSPLSDVQPGMEVREGAAQ